MPYATRKDLELVVHALYKAFPEGLVAGGMPRDILMGNHVKDVDFWLPAGVVDIEILMKFVQASPMSATFINTFEAARYGMNFDEERIRSIYQLEFKSDGCFDFAEPVRVDIIECAYAEAWQIVSTFTDNISRATCSLLGGRLLYTWVDTSGSVSSSPEVPTFTFDPETTGNPRYHQRYDKIMAKWNAWVADGKRVYAY